MRRSTALILLTTLFHLGACASGRTDPEATDRAADMPAPTSILVDASGRAMPETRVVRFVPVLDWILAPGRRARWEYRTDGEGRLPILAETDLYLAERDGELVPLRTRERMGAEGSREQLLEIAGETRFVLLEIVDEKGRGLAGSARVRPFGGEAPFIDDLVYRSDASGRLRIDRQWWPEKDMWLEVAAPGMLARRVLVPTHSPGHAADAEATRLVLERPREARTFAVDDATGLRVRPNYVEYAPRPHERDQALAEGSFIVEPDRDGSFSLMLGGRRPFSLKVVSEDHVTFRAEDARIETLEIRLQPWP